MTLLSNEIHPKDQKFLNYYDDIKWWARFATAHQGHFDSSTLLAVETSNFHSRCLVF